MGFDNVGKVIEAVLEIVGKRADALPTGRTVSHMNDERLLLSQLQSQENLMISTDETPKGGDIYMTYTVSGAESSYVLGLREMALLTPRDSHGTKQSTFLCGTKILGNGTRGPSDHKWAVTHFHLSGRPERPPDASLTVPEKRLQLMVKRSQWLQITSRSFPFSTTVTQNP